MDDIVKRKFWQRMKGLNFDHFCDAMNELHTRAYELGQKHTHEAMSCHPRISSNMIETVKVKAVQIREEWDDCREVLTVDSTLEILLEEIIARKSGLGW
ncbi:hypothetical protein PAECIP111891_04225 [Paenibacillus allorhizoplanae]|uniref:Uncharacterized protein n=1 Tax=Paenibacillus allorhizoplanae TaxID=2905648 RepID=A0ABM9CK37_9BACL|nr:hypothetical protein [Paenibacillus allorhizoplanae]CAH1215185.1 hypothetical protein PAECIP111891_04225 [Paenibacillus allorhizoplanae]